VIFAPVDSKGLSLNPQNMLDFYGQNEYSSHEKAEKSGTTVMELLERRNVQRIEQETKVAFTIMSGGEFSHHRKRAHSLTRNISLSGIMIRSDVFIPVGSLLTLELSLEKNPELITVIAQVRWIKSLFEDETFAIGLEFVDLPTAGLNALLSHLFAC